MHALKAGGLAVALLLATATSASASEATCGSDAAVTYSPGLSLNGTDGSFKSNSPSAIRCSGELAGGTVTGKGSWSFKGRYGAADGMSGGGDCLYATGSGTFAGNIPSVSIGGGSVSLTGTYRWRLIGLSYWAAGTGVAERTQSGIFNGWGGEGTREGTPVRFTAVGELLPTAGDCVNREIASGRLVEDLVVTETSDGRSGGRTEASEAGRSEPCAVEVLGSPRPDRLDGTRAGDWIRGYGSRDRLRGRPGDDCVFGDAGRDRLIGGAGNDHLEGGARADRLAGGPGADTLAGGRGADRIHAGAGSDIVNVAGGGVDRVNCGPGFDRVRADRADRLRRCERVKRVER